MSLLDILKKKGLTKHTFKSSIAKTPKRKSPRETLVEQLRNNLKEIADPAFRIKNRKGEMIKPDPCYKIDGALATVWASYSKKRIKLDGEEILIEIPTDELKDYIEAIIEAAEKGLYDDQLAEIQGARSKSQTGTTRKKK